MFSHAVGGAMLWWRFTIALFLLQFHAVCFNSDHFETDLQEPGSIASTRMQAFDFGIKVISNRFEIQTNEALYQMDQMVRF